MRRLIIAISLALTTLVAVPVPTYAADLIGPACNVASGSVCASRGDDAKVIAKDVADTLLYVLGVVSVIMIIVGGFRFTTANGDAAVVKSAKNTVFYAVIGLVIALLSFAIVNFVLGKVG